MTLEEKARIVVGVGIPGMFGNPRSRVPGAAGETHPIERFGIPSTVFADGPAGLRINPKREGDEKTYHATAFPVATMLASTWNREILEEVGRCMGEEVKEYGVDIL
ncbi:MAG: beta-glucosidase, partial [Thermoproteota archaeon]